MRFGDQRDFFYGFENVGVTAELDYTIFAGDGADEVRLSYVTSDVTIRGNAGDDALHAGLGTNELRGGKGNDTLTSQGGNGLLSGGNGEDRIESFDLLSEGGNRLFGGDGDDNMISAGGGFADGGSGDDEIYAGGAENEIHGGSGNDIIEVAEGNSRMYGGQGNDRMRSLGDNAEIRGNAGNDMIAAIGDYNELRGGKGLDFIGAYGRSNDVWGGKGADYFQFVVSNFEGTATIHDFSAGEDLFGFATAVGGLDAPQTTEDAYDYFHETATQVGNDVSWDNGNGFSVLIKGVTLDDFSLATFDTWDFFELQG